MTLEPFDVFLTDLRRNIEDPIYLNDNEEVIFDWLLEEGVKPHRIPQVAEALRRVIPHYLRQPSVKAWEQLILRYLDVSLAGDVRDRLTEAQLIFSQYLLTSSEGRHTLRELAKARKLAQHSGNVDVRIAAYVEILKANLFSPGDRLLEPQKTYAELLAYAETTTNPETRAIIYYAFGMYHLRHGETDKALHFTTQSYLIEHAELAQQQERGYAAHDTRTRMIEARIAMGIAQRHHGDLAQSAATLREALAQCVDELDSYPKAIISHELAWIDYREGRHVDAVDHAMSAKLTFETLRHHAFVAACNHSLGIMLIELGSYERALKLLGDALQTYSAMPHYIHMVDVHHAIGWVHQRRATDTEITASDLVRAEQQLKRAADIARQHLNDVPKRRDHHLANIAEDLAALEDLQRRFREGGGTLR